MEVSGQVGAEKEFLHQIERKVEKPFRYEWVEGWSTLLGSMVADLGVVMALFLGIVFILFICWANGMIIQAH